MTNEIENTKRELYGCLDRIRRAGKHRVLTAELEERLEEHLEALRKEMAYHASLAIQMREERDGIQGRLQAVDHSYFVQSLRNGEQARQIKKIEELNRIAGECIQDTQTVNRSYQIEIKALNHQLQARDETIGKLRRDDSNYKHDCIEAEKLSDDLSEKLTHATTVIGQQEQLIAGQRLAIAELHMAGRSAKSAVATLQRLGYTDCGGQLWKPPLGQRPHFEEWCTNPMCESCRARAGRQ